MMKFNPKNNVYDKIALYGGIAFASALTLFGTLLYRADAEYRRDPAAYFSKHQARDSGRLEKIAETQETTTLAALTTTYN